LRLVYRDAGVWIPFVHLFTWSKDSEAHRLQYYSARRYIWFLTFG
jgi:hypothetical protein